MWVAAFFGMATIYGEAVLAQTFKTKDESGHVIGGPVYYIRAVFKGTFGKLLAGFFALAIIFALGFTGNMVQSNAISNAFQKAVETAYKAVMKPKEGTIWTRTCNPFRRCGTCWDRPGRRSAPWNA